MVLCGICCKTDTIIKCTICYVNACDKCYVTSKYKRSIAGLYICALCNIIGEKLYRSTHCYCKFCDECVPWRDYYVYTKGSRCVQCINTPIENRSLLPHYKARPIIETYYIPDIAQLIFDYYYKPRRYFKGEG
jgi:hypothetical protein